jgi:hypothetical protein
MDVVDDEVIGEGLVLDLTLQCLVLDRVHRVSYQRLLWSRFTMRGIGLHCARGLKDRARLGRQ